jgi:ribosome-interacting GTPase 1
MSPELKQQYNKHKENLLVSLSQLEMASIQGKIEGVDIGITKEKRQTIINGFKNGLEIKMISNITQLAEKDVIKILKEEGLMK